MNQCREAWNEEIGRNNAGISERKKTIEKWRKKIEKPSKKGGKQPRTHRSKQQTAAEAHSRFGTRRSEERMQESPTEERWSKALIKDKSNGGKKIPKKQQKILNSNVPGYRRNKLRCTHKSSCSKDGERMKMERRESARDGEREKSRSKTSSKLAMADYILSRARHGSPAGPGPPGPFSSERRGETGRRRTFPFLLFFWFFAFLFQCLGNSLLVKWGKELNKLTTNGAALFFRWPKC